MTEEAADEPGLVRRMRAGEESAFGEFFEGFFPRLYRFALARLDQDADAAEDVVQVTLCKAVSGLRGYRFESSLFTWLCAICRREIATFESRRGRRRSSTIPIEDTPDIRAALESLAAGARDDPESALRRREVSRLVQVTLDALPRRYGDVLEWKYVQGMSVLEIAGRLDLGVKAAESLLTRARDAFRDGFSSLRRAT